MLSKLSLLRTSTVTRTVTQSVTTVSPDGTTTVRSRTVRSQTVQVRQG